MVSPAVPIERAAIEDAPGPVAAIIDDPLVQCPWLLDSEATQHVSIFGWHADDAACIGPEASRSGPSLALVAVGEVAEEMLPDLLEMGVELDALEAAGPRDFR